MTTITFDTLKYADTLAAGIPREQAKTQAKVLSDVMEVNLKELVTKEHLDARLVQLEQRMTLKLGVMLTVAVGVMGITAALVKVL